MNTTITIEPITIAPSILDWIAQFARILGTVGLVGGISVIVTLLVIRRALLAQAALPLKTIRDIGGGITATGLLLFVASFVMTFIDSQNAMQDAYPQITQHQTVALNRAGFHNTNVTMFMGRDDHPVFSFTGDYNGRPASGSLQQIDVRTYIVFLDPAKTS